MSEELGIVRPFTGAHNLIIAPTTRHSAEVEDILLKDCEDKESVFFDDGGPRKITLMLLAGTIEMDSEKYEIIKLGENFVFQADVYGVSGISISTRLAADEFSRKVSGVYGQYTGKGKPSRTLYDDGVNSVKTFRDSSDLIVHDMATAQRFVAGVLQVKGQYAPN